MHEISIDMFEAGNGDSFLVRFSGQEVTNILIDFGYTNTYKSHIEKNLKKKAEIKEHLDLVVITHIDQDHISGGLHFFESNGNAKKPEIIEVKEVWHNSYRQLEMAETTKRLSDKERTYIRQESIFIDKNRDGKTYDTSGKQGSRLAANLRHHKYNWNKKFDGYAIMHNAKPITLNNEVKITVLTPGIDELMNLRKVWKKELKRKFPNIDLNNEDIFDDAVECISLMKKPKQILKYNKDTSSKINIEKLANINFPEDTDEINASSITFIIEFKGKKLLFLGDSPPLIIVKRLKEIYGNIEEPIYFDVIKISHHGSAKNTSNELLEIIDSENYFISTNGKVHGHPDIETIAKIINREAKDFNRHIYLTNQLESLKLFENEQLQIKYHYSLQYRSISQDSLKVFL